MSPHPGSNTASNTGRCGSAGVTTSHKKRKWNQKSKKIRKHSKGDDDEDQMALHKCSQVDFIQLAEALLCFHAWYKMDPLQLFDPEDKEADPLKEVDASVHRLLTMVRTFMP